VPKPAKAEPARHKVDVDLSSLNPADFRPISKQEMGKSLKKATAPSKKK
jgi:hypothetical protein